jgi:cyclophilin family peptidyl-prolyl cis-trans isomerase
MYEYEDRPNTVLYQRQARKAFHQYLEDNIHQHCFLDIAINSESLGRIVIELYDDICPRTCQNFVALCTGSKAQTYINVPFHRVVPEGWIQGGDISGGSGGGGESIFGATFPDESFEMKHSGPGILAMANSGPHSNGSQFYITMRALPWLDQKRVCFGRVISGMRVVKLIGKTPLRNERPVSTTYIYCAGVLDKDTPRYEPRVDLDVLESKEARK